MDKPVQYQSNGFRQTTEAKELRIKEAQEKLVRNIENALVSKLLSKFHNGKVTRTSEADLKVSEGLTSSDIRFNGTVKVHADVFTKKGRKVFAFPVPVTENAATIEDDTLGTIVDTTEEQGSGLTVDIVKALPMSADLSQFSLVDDGSKYLKVYHPVLDSGREIGVVGKNEYSFMDNKETFFREMLENQIKNSNIENHYELDFVGSFVMPSVTIKADEAPKEDEKKEDDYKHPTDMEDEVEDKILRAQMADTFRQSIEVEARKVADKQERLMIRLTNEITSHLFNLKYSSVKIASIDTDKLQFTDDNFNGDVVVSASFYGPAGLRNVTIPLIISASTYKLPKQEVVAELFNKGLDLRAEVETELKQELETKLAQVDAVEEFKVQEVQAALKVETVTKTASDSGGTQYMGPMEVVKVERHLINMPEDSELGTLLYADGSHWKLVSKDDANLGKESNSGSVWTFHKVAPDDKKPEGVPAN